MNPQEGNKMNRWKRNHLCIYIRVPAGEVGVGKTTGRANQSDPFTFYKQSEEPLRSLNAHNVFDADVTNITAVRPSFCPRLCGCTAWRAGTQTSPHHKTHTGRGRSAATPWSDKSLQQLCSRVLMPIDTVCSRSQFGPKSGFARCCLIQNKLRAGDPS